ncbi:methyltransferase [Persicimonas caeni]|nr:methyltransferase [Persicimonas caeni]
MSKCPSCPLVDLPYAEQLHQKHQKVARAFGAYPQMAGHEIPAVHPSPHEQGYRNRARMVVLPKADASEALLGFYEEGSRQVVPVERCEAHHPTVETVLGELRPLLFTDGLLRWFTRFVDVRSTAGHPAAEEAAIVTLCGEVAEHDRDELEAHAATLHRALDEACDELRVSLHLNLADEPSQSVLAGEQQVVAGDAWLDVEVTNREFRVPPTAFFQVNLDALEAVHRRMDAVLGDDESRRPLVDLYCGVGAHGVALAEADTELLGTDIEQAAIDLAEDNARRAELHAEFRAAADTHAADWLADRLDGRAYRLITNPARAGMSAQTVAFVGATKPDCILYLSCEPHTLARDLDRLLDHGFRLESIEPFDFMPQTDQVETLAVLTLDDASTKSSRERAYQPQGPAQRTFSPGVSGPNMVSDTVIDASSWVALVAGETPKHGFLPKARGLDGQGRIEVERLRKVEGNSVVRVKAPTLSDDELRQRFRAWNHPVLGDPDYGDRNANHLAARHAYLDRMALHCVEVRAGGEVYRAEVPGSFLALMRLPRKVLEG